MAAIAAILPKKLRRVLISMELSFANFRVSSSICKRQLNKYQALRPGQGKCLPFICQLAGLAVTRKYCNRVRILVCDKQPAIRRIERKMARPLTPAGRLADHRALSVHR